MTTSHRIGVAQVGRAVRPGAFVIAGLLTATVILLGASISATLASAHQATRTPALLVSASAPVPEVVGNHLVNATTGLPLRLLGVDDTGTEDACIMNKGFSGGPISALEATAIAGWHTNAVRVPLNEDCWLGINGSPSAYSGVNYQSAIESWVAGINQAGLVAILDLHWSAPNTHVANQEWPMPDHHSLTFWTQVASAFASSPSVMFDVFNEPALGGTHPTTSQWGCWLNGCTVTFTPAGSKNSVSYNGVGMQALVNSVRQTGATQPIMVGGLTWAGDPCGTVDSGGNGGTCMWLANAPTDPDHQLVASFHTYNWTAATTPSQWAASVLPVAASVPVVTGEFGEADSTANYVNQYMQWADQNGISYLAWAWQLAGTDTNPSTSNLKLVSTWSGVPNTYFPMGAAYKAHLALLSGT